MHSSASRGAFSAFCRLALLASSTLLLACQPSDPRSRTKPTDETVGSVTVEVCGQPISYTAIPRRAVSHDVNITEMMLYLGLGDTLVGHSGLNTASKEIDPLFADHLADIPSLSKQGMNLEAMLAVQADFVFGGWGYGFREGQVTPQRLADYNVASYVLRESCIRVIPREEISVTDAIEDMRNLGKIFRINERATPQLDALQLRADALSERLRSVKHRPRVLLYDSGSEIPVTSGKFGMPSAMIRAAGGQNIFDDLPSNWPRGNWEDVIERDPEWIVIVDYGVPNAQGKIDFLRNMPELAHVHAIRNQQFFVMRYAEATPGPRNIPVAEKLARALHPEFFSGPSSDTP